MNREVHKSNHLINVCVGIGKLLEAIKVTKICKYREKKRYKETKVFEIDYRMKRRFFLLRVIPGYFKIY